MGEQMFDSDDTQETLLALTYVGAVIYKSGLAVGLTEAESMTLTAILVPIALDSPGSFTGL